MYDQVLLSVFLGAACLVVYLEFLRETRPRKGEAGLRWETPPDATTAISAEAMTSSFGASVIERTSYLPIPFWTVRVRTPSTLPRNTSAALRLQPHYPISLTWEMGSMREYFFPRRRLG